MQCCSSFRSEKAVAPHSSTLAGKIPWTEEPGGLQSMGSLSVRHDWATSLSLFTFMHWRRKWQPTPVFLPGESQGRGAWWAVVYGVTQSRTRLKRLSSSSSSSSNSSFRYTAKLFIYMCIYVCVCVCVYTCICICICILFQILFTYKLLPDTVNSSLWDTVRSSWLPILCIVVCIC